MTSFNPTSVEALLAAFAAEGSTDADLLALAERRPVIIKALTAVKPNWVDCSGIPKIPAGCRYEESDQSPNLFRGLLDLTKIDAKLCPTQIVMGKVGGEAMLLEHAVILPSHVIDRIEADPSLFREEWQGKYVICGTVFRNADGDRVVRCVYRHDGEVFVDLYWLSGGFGRLAPMAVPRE